MKLWQKDGVSLSDAVEAFTVGNDYLLDMKLLKYDIFASIVHAKMLGKIGILRSEDVAKLEASLNELSLLVANGSFKIAAEDEDCHTVIENYLVLKLGDLGKKIHTCRSRNDQVMVALRLYMKDELLAIENNVKILIGALEGFSGKFGKIKMPGYTHFQKAMPSSVGLWSGAFAESLKDDLVVLLAAKELIDQNPLGSAAGYGLPLPIDREFTSKLLGFDKVQNNPLYCANSRGKFEALVLSALVNLMVDLNKMSSDIILFSTSEFGFFKLPKEVCTGSSIMPQKVNPDPLELIRGKLSSVKSNLFEVWSIISNLPSGYHRDFQLTKEPLMKSFDSTKNSIEIMTLVVSKLLVDEEKCSSAMSKELFAVEKALEKVKNGMSFREAYNEVAKELAI